MAQPSWKMVLWAIGAASFIIIESKAAEGVLPEVATRYGSLRGKRARVKGTEKLADVFLGVPFARPPTGSLRFSPPQPPQPWDGVKDATAHPTVCPQDLSTLKGIQKRWKETHPPLHSSEDCLYLNIYRPANSSHASKFPVMVWIHGGEFIFGAASRFDGSALAAYEDVVVVIIQYRLGILGFFSTGDENARGNWAALDHLAAFRWIRDNIKPFGGDPESVTLFGVSAGSFLVSAHMQKLAQALACEASSSAAVVQCLRQKSERELIASQRAIQNFGLVVDGVFLPKTSEDLLAGKELNAVPLIVGVTNNEFGWNIRRTSQLEGLKEPGDRNTMFATLRALGSPLGVPEEVLPMLLDEYLGDTSDPDKLRDGFLDLLGDAAFVVPAIRTLNYLKEAGAPVYFFEYQHRPSLYHDTKPDYVKADHADEVGFVFGGPFLTGDTRLRDEATEDERLLSRTMMKYWANFARTGNPNRDGLVEWPAYNNAEQYLELNLKQKASRKLKEEKVEFWMKRLPEKIKELRGRHTEL
ncbi:cocaine esterase isoform X2 [Varanus komodoensis]|uniref:cocaine esterase isoform X2 n=1 Tax=Varanus komodoensis TaxID=61221 RepID=UPI001CF7A640|nr:cocaine esterase isoform X2 [Varanus komodoensis]